MVLTTFRLCVQGEQMAGFMNTHRSKFLMNYLKLDLKAYLVASVFWKNHYFTNIFLHITFHSFLKPFKWIKPGGNFLKDSFLNYCFFKFSFFFFFLCLYGNQTSTCTYCGYGNPYSTISNVLDFVAEKKLK